MTIFGTGVWGAFGTSSSGQIYLTWTDADQNALIGTSLPPIANLPLFGSATVWINPPLTGKAATIDFTPTFAVIPEPAAFGLAVPALLLFSFGRRR